MTFPLPPSPSPVEGEVVVPGSKSETNRALVLAALADGPSTLRGALESRDSSLMVAALEALGVEIRHDGEALRVTPPSRFRGAAGIDCGLAGTVMRFVPPLAALAGGGGEGVVDAGEGGSQLYTGVIDSLTATPVPEPAWTVAALLGAAAYFARRRRVAG